MTNNNDTFTFTSFGTDMLLKPETDKYANGRKAIRLLYLDNDMGGWFPFCTLTVNLPDQHLNEGEVFIKDWAENEEIVAHLTDAGWLIDTGREVLSGFVVPRVMRTSGPLA